MAGVLGRDLRGFEEIFGIDNLIDVHIHAEMNSMVTAEVTFALDHEKADAVLRLLRDGKWEKVEQ